MRSRYSWPMAALGMLAIASCSEDNDPTPPPAIPTASVAANPNNTISAVVTVYAPDADSARIRFWSSTTDTAFTPAEAFGGDTLELPVLGLDTVTSYSLEVQLFVSGAADPLDTLEFTTGSLPTWIPRAVPSGADPAGGLLLLSYPNGPVIQDNAGKVVWYKSQPGGVLGSWQAQANGLYTWLGQADSSGYYVFDRLGNEVGRYACVGYKTRFHDVLILANGERWIMCDKIDTLDLSADSGSANATVYSSVVQHQSAAGTVVFEWRSLDHFDITDAPSEIRVGTNAVNFTHANGITLDTDGNLLVSFRSLNEITKINASTGDVIWRLGGLANQFTFVNDTKGFFEQQHGLRVVAPNTIQLLDNGRSAPSRAVRYVLDPVAHTATLQFSFIDAPSTFTIVGGSTQVLPAKRGLVSFGREGRVVEFDSTGTRTYELTGIDDIYVFRAQRINSLYTPGQ